jgi:hypothetical protein
MLSLSLPAEVKDATKHLQFVSEQNILNICNITNFINSTCETSLECFKGTIGGAFNQKLVDVLGR